MNTCAEKFKNFLEGKGLHFDVIELKDGDVAITIPNDGKLSKCFFSGDDGEYLSIYITFDTIPKEKLANGLVICNELNTKYKWITFYIDNDLELTLHDDAILSPDSAADEAFELVLRMFHIMNDVKPEIMRAIYA